MDCCKSNPPDYKFCAVCGTRLDRAVCDCGFSNGIKNVHCGNCGKQLHLSTSDSHYDNPNQVKSDKIDLQQLTIKVEKLNKEKSKAEQKRTTMSQSDIQKMFSSSKNEDDDL